MPYVNIKITNENVTAESKQQIIQGVTDLLQKVFNKNPATTVIVVDDVSTENCGINGNSVSHLRNESFILLSYEYTQESEFNGSSVIFYR